MRIKVLKAIAVISIVGWSLVLIASFFDISIVPQLELHPEVQALGSFLTIIALLQYEVLEAVEKMAKPGE